MTEMNVSHGTYSSFAGLPLKRLMEQWNFPGCRVLAGKKGLSNAVKWVHCSDMPDITYWLRGNELLFHTGKNIKEMDLLHLVRQLHQANAAGLCIVMPKPEIPREIVELADELGFPVLYVPDHYRFVDITFAIAKILFAAELNLSLQVENFWTQVREKGLIYADIEKQISFVADFLQTPVALYDQNLLLHDVPVPSQDGAMRLNVPDTFSQLDQSRHLTFPITLNEKKLGHLVFPKPADEWELTLLHRLISHISHMIALTLGVSAQVRDLRLGLKMSLFEKILKASEAESGDLYQQANKLQLNLTAEARIATIYIPDKSAPFLAPKMILDVLNSALGFTPLFSTFGQFVKILIPHGIGKTKLEHMIAHFQKALAAKLLPDVTLKTGVGKLARGIKGIQESSEQSDIALDCAKDGEIVWYEALQFWEILKHNTNLPKALADMERRLKSLSALERSKLLETVSALVETNFNYSEAARALNIHRNGLRERLKRYSHVTGCDFNRVEEVVSIWLILGRNKET